MKIKRYASWLLGIFAFTAFGLALAQVPPPPGVLPSLGGCQLYSSTTPVPAGYGAAYDVLSAGKELLMQVLCNASGATVNVGKGSSSQIIYNQGYKWMTSQNKWVPITYSGTPYSGNASWLSASAAGSIPASQVESGTNYVVAYVCTKVNDSWQCGCSDNSCATHSWNLQAFTPNTTLGGGDNTLTVTKAGTGTGTITSSPAGINCGNGCSGNYAVNTSVILTATPTTGSIFVGWSGDCSGTGICTLIMSAAKSVTAIFLSPPPPPASLSCTAGATKNIANCYVAGSQGGGGVNCYCKNCQGSRVDTCNANGSGWDTGQCVVDLSRHDYCTTGIRQHTPLSLTIQPPRVNTTLTYIGKGDKFQISVGGVAPNSPVYYDVLDGPDGPSVGHGPLGTTAGDEYDAYLNVAIDTSSWTAGGYDKPYTLVAYTRDSSGQKNSGVTNTITVYLLLSASQWRPSDMVNGITSGFLMDYNYIIPKSLAQRGQLWNTPTKTIQIIQPLDCRYTPGDSGAFVPSVCDGTAKTVPWHAYQWFIPVSQYNPSVFNKTTWVHGFDESGVMTFASYIEKWPPRSVGATRTNCAAGSNCVVGLTVISETLPNGTFRAREVQKNIDNDGKLTLCKTINRSDDPTGTCTDADINQVGLYAPH